jgi:lipoprotein-anchoring transpeptidase ErfK/SrfK
MRAFSLISRFLMLLAAALTLTLSGAMAWAVANDYQVRGLVPKGVSVVGRDLGGLTETQARHVIAQAVSEPMMRPVQVGGDGKTWTLEPKGFVSIDEESMLRQAYTPLGHATFLQRLDSELRGTPLPAEVQPAYAVDRKAITAWVKRTAAEVDRKPVDAKRRIVGYEFKITDAAEGARVDQGATADRVAKALDAQTALSDGGRSVELSIAKLKPKVTRADFKTAIIVSLSERLIRLYDGDKLVKSYRCAPGQPDWPTPTGDFTIDSKSRNAPWINPGSDWAKSMPKIIPGGPNNPMGDTKIGIDYPGVYMHSVPPSEYESFGSYASHGCMRMMPSAVHDLYRRVHIGDRVYIRD